MLRVNLSESEEAELKKLRRKRNSDLCERAYYVLLSSKCLSVPAIAKRTGRNGHTVREWIKRYQQKGISGLKSVKQAGRPSTLRSSIESELDRLLSQSPEK